MPTSKSLSTPTVASQISDLSRLMRRSFNRYMKNTGLTYPQWRVIAALSKTEGIKQAVLAERMDIQPISIARLIDRMESAGWVERRPDPRDRRAVQLFLTPKAKPILDEIGAARGDFEEEALAGISAQERDELRRLLGKIRANLEIDDSDLEPAEMRSLTK